MGENVGMGENVASGFDLQPQDLSLKDRDFAPYIPQKHRMI